MKWFGSAAPSDAAKKSAPKANPPPAKGVETTGEKNIPKKLPRTGEFDTDVMEIADDILEFESESDSDGTVQAVGEAADVGERTLQVDLPPEDALVAASREPSGRVRDRRATLVSPIPAIMAASMGLVADTKAGSSISPPGRNGRQPTTSTYTVEVGAKPERPIIERVSEHIESARALLDAHDFHSAARIAEETLSLGESVSDSIEVTKMVAEARPMIEQIFAGYVGSLTSIPVLVKTWDEIMTHKLGDSTRSFLRRIDGVRTMEQILGHSSIPPQHAFRIVASALRAGFIRTG
jgi:hypothetical protein